MLSTLLFLNALLISEKKLAEITETLYVKRY